jgi:hypothetical protein
MHCALYRNDVASGGRFTNVSSTAGIRPDALGYWGAAPADIDGDGDLDLVVTAVAQQDQKGYWTLSVPITLYRNRGDGTFEDASATSGLGLITGNVKNPVWIDYDHDGDPDLYIAGMQEQRLFRNDGNGQFTNVTSALPDLGDGEPHVWAAAAADFDQDGWEDLYLGRWDEQDYVLLNQHDGTWKPAGRDVGIDKQLGSDSPENTMGLGVGDIDDDGYPDALIGPGAPWFAAPPIVYCNDGASHFGFHRCSESFVAGNGSGRHHGIALADYNHDGATDIVYNRGGMIMPDDMPADYPAIEQQPALYLQRPPSAPQTAVIHLVGTVSNRSAIGARIEVGGAAKHYYTIHGAQGFQSQNSDWLPVFVGGTSAPATVYWPSGRTSQVELLRGRRTQISEPR